MRLFPSIALTAVLILAAPVAALAEAATITVTGEGQVQAAPDMATLSLGVTTEAATAAEALAENTARLTAVFAVLEAAGIAPADIQTSGLSVNPRWDSASSSEGQPQIGGYIATNGVTVSIRALDGLGAVLDAVVSGGANTLNGLSFGLADPAPVMDEARRRAVADGLRKADLLAAAAGVKLGTLQTLTENTGYAGPQPMFRMGAEAADSVPLAYGEMGLSATVTMVFAIGE
ncbi:MAG: SIMPL domain-containing protein [Paracoccaceae bacterium]